MTAITISEVIAQLNEIVTRSADVSERAGYFAALYKRVTIAVADKTKQGYFDDNTRMEKLDIVFANRYLEAYQNYRGGKSCSHCWQLAFDTTKLWKPMILHHLLAGMNAHISLDLGVAAATVSPGAGINDVQNDFYKINEVLKELVEELKTDLFDRWPLSKLLVKLNIGKFENELAGFSMNIARDAAWQQAIDYAPLNTAVLRDAFIYERDETVTAFGKKFLYPGRWITFVTSVLRVFEFGTISSKIKKLDRELVTATV